MSLGGANPSSCSCLRATQCTVEVLQREPNTEHRTYPVYKLSQLSDEAKKAFVMALMEAALKDWEE